MPRDEGRSMSVAMPLHRWVMLREQRCLLLFFALLALLVVMPFLAETAAGRWAIGVINVLILATAVGTVQRSRVALVIAVPLGVPAFVFQVIATQSETPGYFAL